MKDHLLQQLEARPASEHENVAREYLQVYLLRLIHERGATTGLAFVGGSALRLLHRLPRFSEDLDFSLTGPGDVDLENLFRSLKSDLEDAGYRVSARLKQPGPIAQAWFRFDGLPAEAGWSKDPRQGLSIRVEADTRPPAGAVVETTLVQRFFPITLRHHDLASMFAGKVHALIARRWAKGRDWFDLVWYLTEHRGLEPNQKLLGNALKQTGHSRVAPAQWRAAIESRLRELDWPKVLADLRPFVERASDLDQLSPAAIKKLLR